MSLRFIAANTLKSVLTIVSISYRNRKSDIEASPFHDHRFYVLFVYI